MNDAPIKKNLLLPALLVARINDYRFTERLPSEAEAIRRLIELGLEAAQKRERRAA